MTLLSALMPSTAPAPLERAALAGGLAAGVDREGLLPPFAVGDFDILLTTARAAPEPWVVVDDADAALAALGAAAARNPLAAAALGQVLRIGLELSFEQALVVESLAYSMLLAGPEFRAWRAANPVRERDGRQERVRLRFEEDELVVALARPEARNAVDAAMRDALVEALEFAAGHPDAPAVRLEGEGSAFCAGGDLDEFGKADPAQAHAVRVAQSPVRLVHRMRGRITARLHGACIGAGIEIPSAAGRIVARPDAWFRLPEVGMGLIPGAGGTVSIPRRIGRCRTCFLALSGQALDAATALEWGLVDALEAVP